MLILRIHSLRFPREEIADATVYGNTPRNCIIGPPQKNVDWTLEKVFKIAGRQNRRFRADFFNLFNHPSFANPPSAMVAAPGPGLPAVRFFSFVALP